MGNYESGKPLTRTNVYEPQAADMSDIHHEMTEEEVRKHMSEKWMNGCETPVTPGERIAMAYNEALATLVDAVNVAKANLAEAEGMLERFRKDTADIGNFPVTAAEVRTR